MHDTDNLDEDEAAPLPWFAMPDRNDDAAVLAWFAAVDDAMARMDAESARELDACIELFSELRALVREHRGQPA